MKLFSRTAGADHGSRVDMIQSLTLTSRTSSTSGWTHSNIDMKPSRRGRENWAPQHEHDTPVDIEQLEGQGRPR